MTNEITKNELNENASVLPENVFNWVKRLLSDNDFSTHHNYLENARLIRWLEFMAYQLCLDNASVYKLLDACEQKDALSYMREIIGYKAYSMTDDQIIDRYGDKLTPYTIKQLGSACGRKLKELEDI